MSTLRSRLGTFYFPLLSAPSILGGRAQLEEFGRQSPFRPFIWLVKRHQSSISTPQIWGDPKREFLHCLWSEYTMSRYCIYIALTFQRVPPYMDVKFEYKDFWPHSDEAVFAVPDAN